MKVRGREGGLADNVFIKVAPIERLCKPYIAKVSSIGSLLYLTSSRA